MRIIKINKNKGFTLIELLVVMAIIGMLSAISLFALNQARTQARDGSRKADLESIRSAFEIYKADCDTYPPSITTGSSITGSSCTPSNSNVYLQSVPPDPLSGGYFYSPGTGNTTYRLCATLENPGTAMSCTGCAGCNYQVTNP